MSQYDQVPFRAEIIAHEGAIFAENPEPRCPCVLLLDTSGSMHGRAISELNKGLIQFKEELSSDSLAVKRVDVALISFGPVSVQNNFVTVDLFNPPMLEAGGDTPMGAAIEQAVSMVQARKDVYKRNGVEYYRPWIFLVTDGGPTDNWSRAAKLIREGESTKQFKFFAVGVEGADFQTLAQISVSTPLKLDGLRFRDLFAWLSNSLNSVSHSQIDESVPLQNPVAPGGWASVD